MKQTLGYRDYKDLLDRFVRLVQETLRDNLVSVVLYGSVARGTAGPSSDVDLLLVLHEPSSIYWKRLQPLLPILRRVQEEKCWKRLQKQGITPHLNLLVLSLEEAGENRYLYLDMIDEARILVDQKDFFYKKLESLRQRLRELGAQKVVRNNTWYWDLKPDLKPGEIVFL